MTLFICHKYGGVFVFISGKFIDFILNEQEYSIFFIVKR